MGLIYIIHYKIYIQIFLASSSIYFINCFFRELFMFFIIFASLLGLQQQQPMIYYQNYGRKGRPEKETSIEFHFRVSTSNKSSTQKKLSQIINRNVQVQQQRTSRPMKNKKSYIKIEDDLCSTDNSQAIILFKDYELLPCKEKLAMPWRGKKNCQNKKDIGFKKKIKYKKSNKIISEENVRFYKSEDKTYSYSSRNEKNINRIVQYLQQANQNQRRLHQIQSQTKFTHCESSTKAGSKTHFPSQKSNFESFSYKSFIKQQAMSCCNKDINSLKQIEMNNVFKNVIPQEYEISRVTSRDKFSRNKSGKSSISINSKQNCSSLKSSLRNSIFLPIHSVRNSNNQNHLKDNEDSVLGGLIIVEQYMQMLNWIANYAQEITQMYDNTEDWEQLIFLAYKKYFLCRIQFQNALETKNIYFFQKHSNKLSNRDKEYLEKFLAYQDAELLKKQVHKQNIKISDSLRHIYNLAIQKSGNFINMQLKDNFSSQIYRLVLQQIQQLKNNYYMSTQVIKNRLKNVIKFLITMAVLQKKQEVEEELDKILLAPMNVGVIERLMEFIKFQFI